MDKKKKRKNNKRGPKQKLEARQFSYFVSLLAALPVDEFVGIARVLKVRLLDKKEDEAEDETEEKTESLLRDFAEIFEEMLDEFLRLTPVQRHNLIWIMEAALSEEGNELHADSKYKHLPTSLLTRRATIESDENAEVIEDATTSTSTD
jgi:hypothetical protein